MYPPAVLSAVAIAGIVFGLVGCCLALWSWRHQRSLDGRVERLEEAAMRERERRARRARLHVVLEQHIEIRRVLVLQNHGPATASGITVSVNGVPLNRSPLVDQEKLGTIGADMLPASHQLRLPLVSRELTEEIMVEVTWSDATGDLGSSRLTCAP